MFVVVDACASNVYFFFFKQKTAYDLRISDWSSDVCSSDLLVVRPAPGHHAGQHQLAGEAQPGGCRGSLAHVVRLHPAGGDDGVGAVLQGICEQELQLARLVSAEAERSEESRIGKEGDSTCRSRWARCR